MEELRLDYSLLTRSPFINFDNDATACFDRILLPISSLVARSNGIHKNVVFVHATTLQEAKFKLKLGKHVSDAFYKHCITFPIHGSGQGSSNSPTIWCFVSSTLFKCHDRHAHGMNFTCPTGDISFTITILGFVDDSTVVTGDKPGQSVQSLLNKASQDAQHWNDLLFTSGGKLELPKCGFHTIFYNFDDSGIPKLLHSTNTTIDLKDHKGNITSVKEKNIFKPRRNLGHYKSPAGTYTTQYETILNKATTISRNIAQCPIGREEAKLLYDSVYRPAIEYTIGQSFLSHAQHKTIESKSLPWIIAKCGYNRNTSRSIIFGPSYLGGAGFMPLEAKQGTDMTMHFLKHWRSPTEQSGKLMRVVLGWTQHQSGMPFAILQNTANSLSYVEGRFMITLRSFLHRIGATIEVDQLYLPLPLRKNDTAIMLQATAIEIFNTHQLKCINAVRMYFGITFLSEISNTDGTHIRESIFTTDTGDSEYTTKKTIITQSKPNNKSFQLWKTLIISFTTGTTSRKLRRPLGKWTRHHSNMGLWKSYDTGTHIMTKINNSNATDHEWNQYVRNGTTLKMTDVTTDYKPMASDIPISIYKYSNGSLHCTRNTIEHTIGTSPAASWVQFIK